MRKWTGLMLCLLMVLFGTALADNANHGWTMEPERENLSTPSLIARGEEEDAGAVVDGRVSISAPDKVWLEEVIHISASAPGASRLVFHYTVCGTD